MSTRTLMRLLIPLMSLALVLVACGQDKGSVEEAADDAATMAEEAGDTMEEAGEAAAGQVDMAMKALEDQLSGMETELQDVKAKLDELPAGVKEEAATKFAAIEERIAKLKTDMAAAAADAGGEQAMADMKAKITTELTEAGQQLQELKAMLPGQ